MIRVPWLEAILGAAILLLGCWLAVTWPAKAGECAGQEVRASWYGTESGDRTANGERFTGNDLTAAHRTLPFNTKLRVSYRGKSVVVRINDRGPFIRGRDLDLSRAAAQRIGMIQVGVGLVCVERL
jgi:rare lipoprotein A